MEDSYVKKSEFLESITEIKIKVNEIDLNVKDLKENMKEVSELSKKLKRLVVESNGRESMIDTIRRHDRELREVESFIKDNRKSYEKKWKMVSETFWKYLIRIVVMATLGMFLLTMASHSELVSELLRQVLKGALK